MGAARIALLLWLSLAAGAASAQDLAARLSQTLEARALRGARVAALVVDSSGRSVFERGADRALIPASNQKVLTAVAALHAFGPAHRFDTELLAPAKPDTKGAVDTLYVRGNGDPTLTSEDFWRLAADLRRAGLTRVRGDLVLDDSAFDSQRWHPTWGKTGSRAYHAPVGALTANYGAFAVSVEPGAEAGAPLRVVVDPPIPYFTLTQRGRTGPVRSRSSLVVDRRAGADGERVVVSGAMPAGRDTKGFNRSVLDPARYAGAVFRLQLEAVGIRVDGSVRRGLVPDDAETLLVFAGQPLSEVVRRFMKYSNNQMGEALMKSLGARSSGSAGTWTNGALAMREELAGLGLPLEGWVLRDGSGLSYENRVTPRMLVATLGHAARDFAYGSEFMASLPLAAADGTLKDRAEGALGRVRAKTGLLTRVTGLSGYALSAEGERLTFSILVNGYRGGAKSAMDAVDEFAAALGRP